MKTSGHARSVFPSTPLKTNFATTATRVGSGRVARRFVAKKLSQKKLYTWFSKGELEKIWVKALHIAQAAGVYWEYRVPAHTNAITCEILAMPKAQSHVEQLNLKRKSNG